MTTQSEIPEYLDWCELCHADGYFRRVGSRREMWQVACSECDHTHQPTHDAVMASRMWNSRIVSGVEHAALSENVPFERDVARRTGLEVFRHRDDSRVDKRRKYVGD